MQKNAILFSVIVFLCFVPALNVFVMPSQARAGTPPGKTTGSDDAQKKLLERYQAKEKSTPTDDPEGQEKLGQWCRNQVLTGMAEKHFRTAYRLRRESLKEDNPKAHEALGDWCKSKALVTESVLQYRHVLKLRRGGKEIGKNPKGVRSLYLWAKSHNLKEELPDLEKALVDAVRTTGFPSYVVIPIKGEIGRYVTADLLRKSLKEAARFKPTVVILEVDSPGGLVSETEKIVDVLGSVKGLRVVAYVKRAISAAAIISLGCKEIYMDKKAIMGAATAYTQLPWELPEVIEEKMQSIIRASCRKAAELGGHQAIIAEAMMDMGIVLHIEEKEGKKIVVEGDGPNILSRKDRLLTLTAQEALDCGLALGIVEDAHSMAGKMGIAGWVKVSESTETLYETHKANFDKALKQLLRYAKEYDKLFEPGSRHKTRLGKLKKATTILERVRKHSKRHPELRLSNKTIDELIQKRKAEIKSLRAQNEREREAREKRERKRRKKKGHKFPIF